MATWALFLITAAAVAGAGIRLARDGDVIAEETGWGGAWVGAILVAAATSLPELITDIHAVLQGHAGLAVGDLFGSNMANMLILAVADLTTRDPGMLTRVAINQALVGTLAISLTTFAVLGVVAGGGLPLVGVGWAPIAIGLTYVAGMRVLHQNRSEPPFQASGQDTVRPGQAALRRATMGFAAAALVILVAAPYLAASASQLAGQLGISQGLAGMVLLAIVTSLPEMAVSVGSVRIGAYSLAVGNLFGSNCFNMVILIPLDILDGPGSLLAQVDGALAVGALFAILMMSLALLEALNKSERRIWAIEPGPAFMILAYVAGLVFTYNATH
jgi:cation:H+ antiporter